MKLLKLLFILTVSAFTISNASADWYHDPGHGLVYKVDSAGENLSLISLQVYGTAGMWRQISRWNHLEAPYIIRIGQVLRLKKRPKGTHEEGQQRVLAYWRKKMGLPAEKNDLTDIHSHARAPAATTEVSSAKTHFLKKDFHEAFERVEALANSAWPSQSEEHHDTAPIELLRQPAAAKQDLNSPPAAPIISHKDSKLQQMDKTLADNGLFWFDGVTARTVYSTLTQVTEAPVPKDFRMEGFGQVHRSECRQKIGANLICVRCPKSPDESTRFPAADDSAMEIKCAGYMALNANPGSKSR